MSSTSRTGMRCRLSQEPETRLSLTERVHGCESVLPVDPLRQALALVQREVRGEVGQHAAIVAEHVAAGPVAVEGNGMSVLRQDASRMAHRQDGGTTERAARGYGHEAGAHRPLPSLRLRAVGRWSGRSTRLDVQGPAKVQGGVRALTQRLAKSIVFYRERGEAVASAAACRSRAGPGG